MKGLRRLSIRSKIIGIVALSTIVPLALAFVVVIYNDSRVLERELVDNTVLITRVTAENSVTDVAFNDRQSSTHTLSKLGTIPGIRWAVIFDQGDRLFSSYAAPGKSAPKTPPGNDSMRAFSRRELRVSEPIIYGDDRYGTLYLTVSTDALAAKAHSHLLTLLIVLLACVGAAVTLATQLQKFVSRPILDLAGLARVVSEADDYSVRAERTSDDEVGILAEGFNEMLRQIDRRQRERDEADRRTREKSQFLANMSHELRTPLNAIIGFSEVLKMRMAERMESREARFLDNIHHSGQHLLGIVNDILDLSKVEAGRMEMAPERFPVRVAVDSVVQLMRGASSRRNVTFEIDVPDGLPEIEADPVKIKQVLYNLLSNAVKFSPDHAGVTVRARADDRFVRISVIDRGIGIDPRDHARIFQEFQQVDSTASRQFEGTGLGLTLVKKFVELHGGTVELESALGAGSTFTVALPIVYHGEGVVARPPVPSAAARERVVLVIEDDPTAYAAIEATLRAAGYVPYHARSGEEGLAFAPQLHPVAITLDVVLPGIDGIEVLKMLKNDPATRAIPVVIVSMIDNRELGLAFGAQDYFVKPVEPERVVESLRRFVSAPPRSDVRLLVIDDDRLLHDLLEQHLADQGYSLLHACGANEGLVRACNELPSLVILDLMMQEMTGFDVAARLKGDLRTAQLPILAVTNQELTGIERTKLQGKINAMVRRGDLSGRRLAKVIEELVQ